jgi:hypothetical protein
MKEGVTLDFVKIHFNRDKLIQELKTTSRWLITLTSEWWSCTRWDCHVFPNLINNMWVLTTPLTHKTTDKNFQVSIAALLQMLGVV